MRRLQRIVRPRVALLAGEGLSKHEILGVVVEETQVRVELERAQEHPQANEETREPGASCLQVT